MTTEATTRRTHWIDSPSLTFLTLVATPPVEIWFITQGGLLRAWGVAGVVLWFLNLPANYRRFKRGSS